MQWIVTLFFSVCLAMMNAGDKGKGNGNGRQGNSGGSGATVVDVRFGTNDVQVIRRYYGVHPVNLPPGLQKKLASGKPLPPGWQKKLKSFPSDIEGRLGAPCGYCGRGVIGGEVLGYGASFHYFFKAGVWAARRLSKKVVEG